MKELAIYLPLLVWIAGLIIYLLTDRPKVTEIGRIMFWVGLLVWLWGGAKSYGG